MEQAVTVGFCVTILLGLLGVAGNRLLVVLDENTRAIRGLNETVSELKVLFEAHRNRADSHEKEIDLLRSRMHDLVNKMTAMSLSVQVVAKESKIDLPINRL